MRRIRNASGVLSRLGLAVGVSALLMAAPAGAFTVPLDVDFGGGSMGSFGSVEITDVGDDLEFTVMLDTSGVGENADLNEFYFNLVPEASAVTISSDDPVETPYTLATGPTRGGAGADFDWGVNFGNGAGPSGNGKLQSASFTLSTDQPLSLVDLSEQSFPNTVDTEAKPILMAAHVQSADSIFGATVGGGTPSGVIPEPGTSLLLGAGLAGLAAAGRRRRR